MDKKQELEIKLEQNKADQARLLDEQAKLQDEVMELGKPKLRHGDYGYDVSGDPTLICKSGGAGKFFAGDGDGYLECIPINQLTNCATETILGNVFDDLERNSEDLDWFEIQDCFVTNDSIRVGICGEDGCSFFIKREGRMHLCKLDFDKTVQFHQKLGQLIAKMQRLAMMQRRKK